MTLWEGSGTGTVWLDSKSSSNGAVVAVAVSLVDCSILAGDPRHLFTIGHKKLVD